jgi:hypothetical protein
VGRACATLGGAMARRPARHCGPPCAPQGSSRIGSPAAAMCCFARRNEYSPK